MENTPICSKCHEATNDELEVEGVVYCTECYPACSEECEKEEGCAKCNPAAYGDDFIKYVEEQYGPLNTPKDDGFEECEWCHATHHYEDKCPRHTDGDHRVDDRDCSVWWDAEEGGWVGEDEEEFVTERFRKIIEQHPEFKGWVTAEDDE